MDKVDMVDARVRPAPIFRLQSVGGEGADPVDRVRIVRRTPDTGGPKGIALYTRSDGRKMARIIRPGDWT